MHKQTYQTDFLTDWFLSTKNTFFCSAEPTIDFRIKCKNRLALRVYWKFYLLLILLLFNLGEPQMDYLQTFFETITIFSMCFGTFEGCRNNSVLHWPGHCAPRCQKAGIWYTHLLYYSHSQSSLLLVWQGQIL